ncbi:helix-turn-helix transcriptional regulator [Natronoglomus mannanivorans]|uniref:MarR family transcriptional regulator n=1 Tax=Natronoglomus mannanivorans TaxID=2979990 RepID=A0AAP2Z238_9EURY|nr:MarR family transcriptional regulator [Halobacteria archaeon AArc-xg1-1]
MDRTKLDAVVAVFVAGTLTLGVGVAWQTSRQAHGEMMGHASVHGPHPVWYLLGSILVASVVTGAYWIVRDHVGTDAEGRSGGRMSESGSELAQQSPSPSPSPPSSQPADESSQTGKPQSKSRAKPQVLDVLPEDERRIVEPVLESPGVTQLALRDRSDFSKSKVSQTVTDLEKRGLLYRERQGRTYRVYPSDDLEEH